jgi:hypothetical protein
MVTKSYLYARGESDRSCERFGLRLLFQQGESLAYVKEQMKPHSIQVTVDIYGHQVPGGNKTSVDRLDTFTVPSSATTIRNPDATITHDTVLGGQVSA